MGRRILLAGMSAGALLCASGAIGTASAAAADVAICNASDTATVNAGANTFAFGNGAPGVTNGTCVYVDDTGGTDLTFSVEVSMNGSWNCTKSSGTMRVTGIQDDNQSVTMTSDYSLTFMGSIGTLTLTNTRDNDSDAPVPGSGQGNAFAVTPPTCIGTFPMTVSFVATWDDN